MKGFHHYIWGKFTVYLQDAMIWNNPILATKGLRGALIWKADERKHPVFAYFPIDIAFAPFKAEVHLIGMAEHMHTNTDWRGFV